MSSGDDINDCVENLIILLRNVGKLIILRTTKKNIQNYEDFSKQQLKSELKKQKKGSKYHTQVYLICFSIITLSDKHP